MKWTRKRQQTGNGDPADGPIASASNHTSPLSTASSSLTSSPLKNCPLSAPGKTPIDLTSAEESFAGKNISIKESEGVKPDDLETTDNRANRHNPLSRRSEIQSHWLSEGDKRPTLAAMSRLLSLPRFVLTNADSGIVTDLNLDDQAVLIPDDSESMTSDHASEDSKVDRLADEGSSFEAPERFYNPFFEDAIREQNALDGEWCEAISGTSKERGSGGDGRDELNASIGYCEECEKMETEEAEVEEDIDLMDEDAIAGKVPVGGRQSGSNAPFRWINDSILYDGEVVNLSDSDLLYGDRWRKDGEKEKEENRNKVKTDNRLYRENKRLSSEQERNYGAIEPSMAKKSVGSYSTERTTGADNSAKYEAAKSKGVPDESPISKVDINEGSDAQRKRPILFATTISMTSSSSGAMTSSSGASQREKAGKKTALSFKSARSSSLTSRTPVKWPWRPKPDRSLFEDRLPLPRLGSHRMTRSMGDLSGRERGGGGGGSKVNDRKSKGAFKRKPTSSTARSGSDDSKEVDSLGKESMLFYHNDSLERNRRRWRSTPNLPSSTSSWSSSFSWTTTATTTCSCEGCSNGSSNACYRMWTPSMLGGGDGTVDQNVDGDDDDQLLEDAVLLSMNSGNYWRCDEDQDEDWLEIFDEVLDGKMEELEESRDDLDEYEDEKEFRGFFYEEGDFHPNAIDSNENVLLDLNNLNFDGANPDPNNLRRESKKETFRLDTSAANALIISPSKTTNLSHNDAVLNKSNSKIDENNYLFDQKSSIIKRHFRLPTPPPSWMSTVSKRHLQFYNLVADSSDQSDASTSSFNDADDDLLDVESLPQPRNRTSTGATTSGCFANWTPLSELAQFTPAQKWAVEMSPSTPCMAHLTPTVKRSDSKAKRTSVVERKEKDSRIRGKKLRVVEQEAKLGRSENKRNGVRDIEVFGSGKNDSMRVTNGYGDKKNGMEAGKRGFNSRDRTVADAGLIKTGKDAEETLPFCLDRTFSNGSASTMMTKLFLPRDSEMRRCVNGSCPSIASTANLSLTTSSRCLACLSERNSSPPPPFSSLGVTAFKRAGSSAGSSDLTISSRLSYSKSYKAKRMVSEKVKELHPDLCEFVEKTIPKLIDLAVVFVNNWIHDKP